MPAKKFTQEFDQIMLWRFTAYTAAMLDIGLPLITILESMETMFAEEKKFAKAIEKVKNDISEGAVFADALEKFPQYFDGYYIQMVRAGELSGILDTIMNRTADIILKRSEWEILLTEKQFDTVLFLKLFSTLIAAGVPMLDTFDILEKAVKNKSMAEKIRGIRTDISDGRSILVACMHHDFCLTPPIMAFISAGESTGALDVALTKACDLYLKEIELGMRN